MPPGQTSNSLHVYLVCRFISLKQYNLTSYILKGLYVLVYGYLYLHMQLYLSLQLYYLYLYWTATVPSLHQGRGLQQPSPILIRNKWTVEIGQPAPATHWSFFHLIRKKKCPSLFLFYPGCSPRRVALYLIKVENSPHFIFIYFHRSLKTITLLPSYSNKQTEKVIISLSSQQIRLSKEANRIIIARPSLCCTSMTLIWPPTTIFKAHASISLNYRIDPSSAPA